MASISSIKSLVLDLPPSCIEFCPDAPAFFVVGTYFLEKKEQDESAVEGGPPESQKRSGSLIVFQLDGDEVKQINTLPTPYAILDIHFSPHDPTLLAVAASTGRLELFRFDPATSNLQPEKQLQLFDPEILVLSLAWHPVHTNLIGVTVSSGEVYLVDVGSAAAAEESATELLKHELEAWTLAFSPDGNAVFSGGDDACLRFADGVVGVAAEDGVGVDWCDRRAHGAGVTAILPLVDEDDVTITGSYDDCIRVVKTVKMGRKQVLAEENLEGGVWRLKMLEENQGESRYILLASCMHAGTRIVEIHRDEDDQWQVTILAKFEEHKSMNYGSDVQPGNDTIKTIISTSFYDKLLCLWRFDKKD